MTIQQAIERAKQLQKERQASETPAAPTRTRRAPQRTPEVSFQDMTEPKVVPLVYPQVHADSEASVRNRIMLAAERTQLTAGALDSYRIIRTQLRSRAMDEGWKRFAITSAGPSEGKSTTALNLALSVARDGKHNVFLLDLDLRNPSMATYLGIKPPAEIGDFLSGKGDPADVFFSVGVENLIIAAGSRNYDNSSELLSGGRVDQLLGYISSIDPDAWVIADLPPLLSTADSLTIAPKMSATILVVAEGKTGREDLDRAVEMIGDNPVAGVILNQSSHASKGYYGYY